MIHSAVGPVAQPFEQVQRIAVLRGGGLGDLMFAMPAIEALARTYPQAQITLLGTPLHAQLFTGRPGPVHEVVVLPYAQGVRPHPDGEQVEDPQEIEQFFQQMRAKNFDLAVQVHGGGRYSNPFLLQLGARHTVGTSTPDAAALERTIPYHYYQHEVLRALEVAGAAGAYTASLAPRVEVTQTDRAEAQQLLAPLLGDASAGHGQAAHAARLVIHPGATDVRRQWPIDSFAALAARAAGDGYQVLLIGDGSEAELCDQVRALVPAQLRGQVHVLAGQMGLGALVGVLEAADVMLGNDSGPRHLAQSVGTPTVGIFWAGNMIMAAPLERSRHRVHLGWVTHCPTCGIDVTQVGWNAPHCRHDFPLTSEVTVQEVYTDVVDLASSGNRRSAGEARSSSRSFGPV